MRVLGTAGHVDHGKSTLVQALTGTHPDRLKEEREREMTIDLGFAWMTLAPDDILPQGEEVGIVDVPGHRDFIENMLSGIGGIDAALFVVAADEGVMPQTREHLAILDLLEIQSGIIVLTKIDSVQDEDWLDLVEDELREVLFDTVLEDAPIVRVSAITGAGLSDLEKKIRICLANNPPRRDLGKPRLPIDRVFSIAGFGTVVTGTLLDGVLRIGDEIEILGSDQAGLKGRVRGLQTHKQKEELSIPGSRTAVNVSGLSVDQIERGCVLAHPLDYHVTRRIDVFFRLLKDVGRSFLHNTEVKLYLGSAEVLARARLLGVEELMPGDNAWLQLELEKPVVAVRGDRFIVRRPSPGETLGGGLVVDPQPKRRHKRFSRETIARLEALMEGTPADILYEAAAVYGPSSFREIVDHANLEINLAESAARELLDDQRIIFLEADISQILSPRALVATRTSWDQITRKALDLIDKFHSTYPLRKGMQKEELKSRLGISPRLFNAVLKYLMYIGDIEESGPLVFRKGFQILFAPAEQLKVDGLIRKFITAPFSPPTVKECLADVGDEIFSALVELGKLTFIPPDVVFRAEDYDFMIDAIRRLLEQQGTITAAQVRDHFNTSRRYVLAVLENMDSVGITIREGDVRRLK